MQDGSESVILREEVAHVAAVTRWIRHGRDRGEAFLVLLRDVWAATCAVRFIVPHHGRRASMRKSSTT